MALLASFGDSGLTDLIAEADAKLTQLQNALAAVNGLPTALTDIANLKDDVEDIKNTLSTRDAG